MGTRKPTIIVAYGLGAASPSTILDSAKDIAQVVFVFDSRQPHSQAMGRALKALAPSFDVSTGYPTVLAELRKLRAEGLVTFSESCLKLAAGLGADLNLEFHSPQTVDRLTNKSLQRTLLNRYGHSRVRTVTVESSAGLRDAVDNVGVPFVAKPLAGFGSRRTLGCRSSADLPEVEQALRSYGGGPWVIEQMMPDGAHPSGSWLGDYVSVESAVIGDRVWHFALTDKLPLVRPFREKGAIMPSSLAAGARQDVLELASGAINALGVRNGLVHTEVKLASGGPQIIELNGRLGGEVAGLVRRSSGFDPVLLAIQIALGTADPPHAMSQIAHDRFAVHYAVLAPEGVFELMSNPDPAAFTHSGHAVWRVEIQHRKGAIVDSSRGTPDAIARVYADAAHVGGVETMVAHFDTIAHGFVELHPVN